MKSSSNTTEPLASNSNSIISTANGKKPFVFPSFSSFKAPQVTGTGEIESEIKDNQKIKQIKEKKSKKSKKSKKDKRDTVTLLSNDYLKTTATAEKNLFAADAVNHQYFDPQNPNHSQDLEDIDFYIDPNGNFSHYKTTGNKALSRMKLINLPGNINQTIPFFKSLSRIRIDGKLLKKVQNYWVIQENNTVEKRYFKSRPESSQNLVRPTQVALNGIDPLSNFIKLEETITNQEKDGESEAVISSHDLGSTEFLDKCKAANRLIHQDPSRIDNWIAFINLQDELITAAEKVTKSLKKAVHSKKMAIVEKALSENPDSDVLFGIFLSMKTFELDSQQMLGLWDKALDAHPSSFSLWKAFIEYRMSNSSSFSFQSLLDTFEECLEKLVPGIGCKTKEGRDSRVAMGYTERAVAVFQALIELNCYSVPQKGWLERLGDFEEFWESELPRFGDANAKGWQSSDQASEDQEVEDAMEVDYSEFQDASLDPFVKWSLQETKAKTVQWLPVRLSIQDEIDDPFQTIVYEDIEQFLVQLLTEKGKMMLLSGFLLFLHAPVSMIPSCSSFFEDGFLHQNLGYDLLKKFKESEESEFPYSFYPFGVEGLVANTHDLPRSFNSKDLLRMEENGKGSVSFYLRILKQAENRLPHASIYILWLNSFSDPKQAEKTGKKILKSRPMDLELWGVYAQLVYKLKGVEEARKIFHTVLSMYQSFPPYNQVGVGSLYSSLALLEWSLGNKKAAICSLLAHAFKSAPEESLFNSESIEKANSIFEQAIEDEETLLLQQGAIFEGSQQMDGVLNLIRNSALLNYLLFDDMERIEEVFQRALRNLNGQKSLFQERLYQMYAQLLSLAIQFGTLFSPGLIRSVLEEALAFYPSNTFLLELYGVTESRTRIDARMRRFLNQQLSKSPSHVLFLFSIWTEIFQTSAPNAAVISNRVSQATLNHPGQPVFWMLAIEKEGSIEVKKQLYYQAIANCPYSKDMHLIAFNQLRECFSFDELIEIHGMMQDREIRLIVEKEFM